MLKNYIDSPFFYDGGELSSTDVNILRNNAKLLEGLANRASPAWCSDTFITGYVLGQTVWRGGFQYRTGMTSANILYHAVVVGSPGVTPQFKIYFNGVEVHTRNLITEAVNISVTVTGLGYTDQDIITVECKLIGNPEVSEGGYDATPDTYYVSRAYVAPISSVISSAYPGTTTFGNLTATNLNNLANSLDWLAERIALIPFIPLMSLRNWQGTFYVQQVLLWRGRVYVETTNPRLYVDLDFTSRSPESFVKIVVNGTTFQLGPFPNGTTVSTGIDKNLITDAGCVNGNSYVVDIYENLTIEATEDPKYNSRLTLKSVRMGNSSYTLIAPPGESQMLESITFATLQSRLNTIKSIADAIKTRIDNATTVFDFANMFRARYGNDTFQQEYWQDEHVVRHKRMGDVLWVKGQGLSIGYGAVTVTTKGDNEKYEYDYQYSQTLTAGDKVESKFVYLDQFEALYPGTEYYIYGKDIIYAAEYLR